jgi:signal transduction histidine kinase
MEFDGATVTNHDTHGLELAFLRHELGQPLHYLENSLTLGRRRLEAAVARNEQQAFEGVFDALDAAQEAAHHLIDLVRRIGYGQQVDDVADVDVVDVVSTTLLIVSEKIERRARLTTDFRLNPYVRASQTRLRQVLLNLLSNALNAVEGANVSHASIAVRVAADEPGFMSLTVEDNGSGIASIHRHRVGEPYFTTNPRGSGLGIAVARSIVESFGGTLTLESEAGRGTRARVVLPISTAG